MIRRNPKLSMIINWFFYKCCRSTEWVFRCEKHILNCFIDLKQDLQMGYLPPTTYTVHGAGSQIASASLGSGPRSQMIPVFVIPPAPPLFSTSLHTSSSNTWCFSNVSFSMCSVLVLVWLLHPLPPQRLSWLTRLSISALINWKL